MSLNSFFLHLTLRLELFTHAVPLPFAIHLGAVASGLDAGNQIIMLITCFSWAGMTVLAGVIWRFFCIRSFFRSFESLEKAEIKDAAEIQRLKLRLMRYPFWEGAVIVIRWICGATPAVIHTAFIIGFDKAALVLQILPFVILMITPLSFMAYFFITEKSLSILMERPCLAQTEIPPEKLTKFNYYIRIILTVFSLVLMPFTLFGYMLYALHSGYLNVDNPVMHVLILAVMFSLPIIFVAYTLGSSVRRGISIVSSSLQNVGMGDFSVKLPIAAMDDFSVQAYHLNQVIARLSSMYSEIRDLNANLEEKVRQRTDELNRILYEQRGDYFLTSLLLEPLGRLEVESRRFTVEFFTRQKKKFEFKEKNLEIGGDLNISKTLTLQGRTYHMFVNSDAMGKSLQGAGGALVLGAVLKSILDKTEHSALMSSLGPSDWLRDTFYDTHKVFESFDGSMLVSFIIGLVEEETGTTYFINADHPWMILFRDGKASFVECFIHRKLGFPEWLDNVKVGTVDLAPGDILISGSDGRDDIELPEMINGERVINEDEYQFLRRIEEAGADLQKIYEGISGFGKIIDDFSLLKITFSHE